MIIGRFRVVVIAIAVVIVAGFAVLGAQIWLLNARIDQLATKVNGIDATFGAKFEETSAKLDGASTRLDAISQRLSAEFKTIGAEIVAQTSAIAKSIASLRGLALTSHLSPARTCDGAKAHAAAEGPAVTRIRNDDDPLDASGVHPQAYPVVRRIIAATKRAHSWISPAGPPGVIDRPR